MPKEVQPTSYVAIVVECFDDGTARVRIDSGHVGSARDVAFPSGPGRVTASTAAAQLEQAALVTAKAIRMQDGTGVNRG